jgi:hypothetical protein
MFCCQHLTPRTVWVPSLLHRPATPGRQSDAATSDAPPQPTTALRPGTLPVPSPSCDNRAAGPATGGARRTYPGVDLSGLPAAPAGFVVRVRSRDAARRALEEGGIAFVAEGRSLVAPPAAARGALIEFRPD